MTEIFSTISNEIKEEAKNIWDLSKYMNPVDAANFLNIYTNIFSLNHTEEETMFLYFYFNMRMESKENE